MNYEIYRCYNNWCFSELKIQGRVNDNAIFIGYILKKYQQEPKIFFNFTRKFSLREIDNLFTNDVNKSLLFPKSDQYKEIMQLLLISEIELSHPSFEVINFMMLLFIVLIS